MSEDDLLRAVLDLAKVAEVAWAAGLFEGEGSFCVPSRAKHGIATLSMTDEDVVRRFAAIVGCGVVHPVYPRKPEYQVQYRWSIQGSRQLRSVIAMFMPYLGERRRKRALEVLESIKDVGIAWGERTICSKGHSLSGDNLILRPSRRRGQRIRACRECARKYSREHMRAWRARQKAAA